MNGTVVEITEDRLTIGLDLGDRSTECCVLGPDGEVLEQSTVPTTQAGLRRWLAGKDSARVILEDGAMNSTSKRYPVEVRERAVRMVLEHEGEL